MDGRYARWVGDLSTRFSGLGAEHVDAEIDRALESLVAFLGTERATMLELLADEGAVAITHSWAQPGIVPAAPLTRTANFPWYYEQLMQGEALRFDRLPDELPPGATAERAYVTTLPMLSHVAVPLEVDGRFVCALLTATATHHRSWSDGEVACIRLVGQILANAIHRRDIERDLRETVSELRELQGKLEAENQVLREANPAPTGFEAIAGQSPLLRVVLADAAQVAPTGASVLLLGETGTGKELLARAIHASSKRADRLFVVVNCAALPPSLVESELFGHEKGAFTGATSARPGRFELADGGTLFLDEIGEIPPEVQVKLLRVLQEGEFERVGATRTRQVDVRIVAATNRDLRRAIDENRFREDLYYRVAVFPIQLPPLRDRAEDIPLLVWELIQRRQDELGRRIERVPESAMRALTRYPWPGNVRELGNVIERALILSNGPALQLDSSFASPGRHGDSSDHIDAIERGHFVRVLERCGWRINGPGNAAELLGMNPSTLRSRMKKLGVDRPRA